MPPPSSGSGGLCSRPVVLGLCPLTAHPPWSGVATAPSGTGLGLSLSSTQTLWPPGSWEQLRGFGYRTGSHSYGAEHREAGVSVVLTSAVLRCTQGSRQGGGGGQVGKQAQLESPACGGHKGLAWDILSLPALDRCLDHSFSKLLG